MSWDPGEARAPSWLPLYSPFETPLHPADGLSEPDPSWGPPRMTTRERLGRIIPSVVVVAAMIATCIGLAAAVRPPRVFDDYLPPDGLSWVASQGGQTVQVEQAVIRSAAIQTSSAVAFLAPQPDPGTRYLRFTVGGAPTTEVLLEATDADLRLTGVRQGGRALLFVPGIALVRDGGAPGPTSRGLARTGGGASQQPYLAEVRSRSGAGCADLAVTVTVGGSDHHFDLGLCRGRGLTKVKWDVDNATFLDLAPGAAGPPSGLDPQPSLTPTPRDWSRHASWSPARLNVVLETDLAQVPGTLRPGAGPVQLGSLLLVPQSGSADLEAYAPVGNSLQLRWRAHPGGDIVAVAAVGELAVVALTDRRLVAYDGNGLRVWETTAVTEALAGEPVALDGALTFATLDGSVWRLDARNGSVVWRKPTGVAMTLGVVADDRVVLAADNAGGIYGFVPSGQQVFNGQVAEPFTGIGLDVNTIYLARGRTIEAYGVQDSRFLWVQSLPESANAVCATGTGLVAATNGGTYSLNPRTGQPDWRQPGARELACSPDAVVMLSDTGLVVTGADGRDVRQVSLTGTSNYAVRALVPTPDRVDVIAPGVAVGMGP